MRSPASLTGLLAPARWPVFVAGALLAASDLAMVALAVMVGLALDAPPTGWFWVWAGTLVVARAAARGSVPVARTRAQAVVRANGQAAIYRHLLGVGPALADTRHSGDVVAIATDAVGRVAALGAVFVPLVLRAVAVPVVAGVVVMTIDVYAGLVVVIALPIVAATLRRLEGAFGAAGDRLRQSQDHLASRFLDAIAGLETLVLYGAADGWSARLAKRAEQVRSETMGVLKVAQRALIWTDLVYSLVSVVAVTAVVLWRVRSGAIGGGEAAAVLLVAVVSISALVDVVSFFYVGGLGLAAVRRIRDLFELPAPLPVGVDGSVRGRGPDRAGVVFNDVSFVYPGASRPALTGVDLEIEAGTSVAVVGPSGSGKSTLADLVLGLRAATTGRVEIAGEDVSAATRGWMAATVAYVGQNSHIFAASIADNLRVARPDATEAEMVEACRRAGILSFVESLPAGFDTVIGERGQGMSGGEAQRLAIARAFLADASVLVLDEATSGLDLETEARVHEAMSDLMKGRTTIAIAHRITTVRMCDRVVVLEEGQVRSVGTPDEMGAGLRGQGRGQ